MCIAEVCEVSLRQQHLDPDVFNGSIVMSLPFIGQRYQLFIQTSLLLPEHFAYEKYCACVRACVRVHFDVGLVAGLDIQINSMQSLHTKSNVKSCSIPFGFFGVDAVWDYVIKYMSKKIGNLRTTTGQGRVTDGCSEDQMNACNCNVWTYVCQLRFV